MTVCAAGTYVADGTGTATVDRTCVACPDGTTNTGTNNKGVASCVAIQ
jgi:hypothetical protein